MEPARNDRDTQEPPPPRGGGSAAALGAYLARRGLKHSRQRERIAEIFFGMGGHVSVDELLVHARREDAG